MRIAFSGYFLDRPDTGSGQYARRLLRELLAMDAGANQWLILCPSREAALVAARIVPDTQARNAGAVGIVVVAGRGHLRKVRFEHVTVPLACRRWGADLLHVPYMGPPRLVPCPIAVTVHDLAPVVLPRHRGGRLTRLYTALAVAGVRQARTILADSQFTGNQLLEVLGLPVGRVHVVYLGGPCGARPSKDPANSTSVRQRYDLDRDYLLYFGGFEWRKNVPALLRAFGQVDTDALLAIAGDVRGTSAELRTLAAGLGIGQRVRFLGRVEEEEKPGLCAEASLFVFPSLFEGFGLPPLEAMAWGAPVLCSDRTSLPEIVGDAGLLFDPEDQAGLARLVQSTLADEPLRQDLRRRGREQAARFTWHRCADETMAAYATAISQTE
ncbi:MAG: glycosyltransferase family 4 protein [Chloroflexi bacterium]|nr:glycosyltransferase family 4 protein [Chloroflexota bacterium]